MKNLWHFFSNPAIAIWCLKMLKRCGLRCQRRVRAKRSRNQWPVIDSSQSFLSAVTASFWFVIFNQGMPNRQISGRPKSPFLYFYQSKNNVSFFPFLESAISGQPLPKWQALIRATIISSGGVTGKGRGNPLSKSRKVKKVKRTLFLLNLHSNKNRWLPLLGS